jgi:prophage maintenance system killer protein
MAGNKDLLAAATYLYSQMVLEHLFIDANRRTAVLAVMWLMSSYDQEVDAEKLINIPIGNIRNKTDLEKLRQSIQDSFLSK